LRVLSGREVCAILAGHRFARDSTGTVRVNGHRVNLLGRGTTVMRGVLTV